MDSLLLQDIAHISADFDPLLPVDPCVFSEGVDPLPLVKDFVSPDAFRSFWKGERDGHDWLYLSEKCSRLWYNTKLKLPMSSLPTAKSSNKKGGRPPMYDWSIKYACRFSGVAKKQGGQQQSGCKSVRQGCPVEIRIQKLYREDRVRIVYYWKHSHATDKVFQSVYPQGRNEHARLRTQVEEGKEWHDLRKILSLSSRQLSQIENNEIATPPAFLFKYSDIRNALYKHRTIGARKHANALQSVRLWMTAIQEEGGRSVFNEDVTHLDGKHYMIAWSTQFQIKVQVANQMRPLLQSIRRAKTEEDLLNQWDAFKMTFPNSPNITTFLEKNWINKEKMPEWAPLYRSNYQNMDTNNLVERWHRNLKHTYLDGKRNLRADDLIYILLGVVDNRYRINYFKITRGLQQHQLTTYEKRRLQRAASVEEARARAMVDITQAARGVISVMSFKVPVVAQYLVEVLADNWLISCSCPDNQQQKITCKHMFLVSRIHPQFKVRFVNNVTHLDEPAVEEVADENDIGQPLEELLHPNLVRQLQEMREAEQQRLLIIQRQENEERKRRREEEKAKTMRECEESIKRSWVKLGKVICSGKARKCTETYFVSACTTLQQAARDIEGIDKVKPGYHCQ
ncbi:hypothetical protein FBU30_010047 [Linnemannia zychae]|nr:hypothetical protein FBU30_010047 [Linnemannia zychae]